MATKITVTILGCGTSGGVPRIGNVWGVCDPSEPKNRRRRASILVQSTSTNIIVDTTPDFREQCLDADLNSLDAVIYTHDHADHTHGIDDLRPFSYMARKQIPVYSDKQTLRVLQDRFAYIFSGAKGYPAVAAAVEIDGPFQIGDISIVPFVQQHGQITSLGFRFGSIAYSTDLDGLPKPAFKTLAGVDCWIVDALRPEPHPSHTHLAKTLGWINNIAPKQAVLTHMTWGMDYATLCNELPAGVEPGYDGMRLTGHQC